MNNRTDVLVWITHAAQIEKQLILETHCATTPHKAVPILAFTP